MKLNLKFALAATTVALLVADAASAETHSKGAVANLRGNQKSEEEVDAIDEIDLVKKHKAEEGNIAAVETIPGYAGHANYDAIPGMREDPIRSGVQRLPDVDKAPGDSKKKPSKKKPSGNEAGSEHVTVLRRLTQAVVRFLAKTPSKKAPSQAAKKASGEKKRSSGRVGNPVDTSHPFETYKGNLPDASGIYPAEPRVIDPIRGDVNYHRLPDVDTKPPPADDYDPPSVDDKNKLASEQVLYHDVNPDGDMEAMATGSSVRIEIPLAVLGGSVAFWNLWN